MKLYDFAGAPNPRRVRIFIAEKGLDIPVETVDVRGGANRTAEFRTEKNPLGLLPVLELDDGTPLSESVAICRYLESIAPEPPLLGVDGRDVAEVEMWNRRMEWELFKNVGHYFRNTAPMFAERYVQLPEAADEARRLSRECLRWLDGVLADREFVAGPRFTIADVTALVAIDLGTPSVLEIAPEQRNLARWHEAVSARPSSRA
jgi:glutathione S-transferase